jgi:hypothetical protein
LLPAKDALPQGKYQLRISAALSGFVWLLLVLLR